MDVLVMYASIQLTCNEDPLTFLLVLTAKKNKSNAHSNRIIHIDVGNVVLALKDFRYPSAPLQDIDLLQNFQKSPWPELPGPFLQIS